MDINLDNIAFSHLSCNSGSARKFNKLSPEDKQKAYLEQLEKRKKRMKENYSYEKFSLNIHTCLEISIISIMITLNNL